MRKKFVYMNNASFIQSGVRARERERERERADKE
jgi:hypothetical protein